MEALIAQSDGLVTGRLQIQILDKKVYVWLFPYFCSMCRHCLNTFLNLLCVVHNKSYIHNMTLVISEKRTMKNIQILDFNSNTKYDPFSFKFITLWSKFTIDTRVWRIVFKRKISSSSSSLWWAGSWRRLVAQLWGLMLVQLDFIKIT